jgi:hypothetical protein
MVRLFENIFFTIGWFCIAIPQLRFYFWVNKRAVRNSYMHYGIFKAQVAAKFS